MPCCTPTPPNQPPYVTTVYTNSGSSVAKLRAKLTPALLSKSVYDFGYSMYKEGRTYPDGTVETVGDPKQSLVNNHNLVYCTKQLTAESTCQASSSSSSAVDASYLQLGDIKFSLLANPTIYSKTLDLAAQKIIRNISNPLPDSRIRGIVTSDNYITSGDSRRTYAKALADNAALGVAFYSLNYMYGIRSSNVTLSAGGTIPYTLPSTATVNSATTGQYSVLSIMENEATKRFEGNDAVFTNDLKSTNTTDLTMALHLAEMEAFNLWMDYQQFRQDERIEALLATSLAKLVLNAAANQEAMDSAANPN